MPNLLAKRGAKGDNIANASKGIVVNVPMAAFEIPKLSRIIATTGPTAVMGARKLVARKIIPTTRIIKLVVERRCSFSF